MVDLKHEIVGKTTAVSSDRLVQNFYRNSVEFSEVLAEHYFLTANEKNLFLDPLNWDENEGFLHEWLWNIDELEGSSGPVVEDSLSFVMFVAKRNHSASFVGTIEGVHVDNAGISTPYVFEREVV